MRLSDFFRAWGWLALTVLAVVAFVLGVVGGNASGLWPRLQDALHLFPSGFPGYDESASTATVIAAHLAPVVTYAVTLLLIYEIYRRQWLRFMLRRRRNHVVVCGLGEKGVRAAGAYLDQGNMVTCVALDVSGDEAEALRKRGALLLEGDATQETVLRPRA